MVPVLKTWLAVNLLWGMIISLGLLLNQQLDPLLDYLCDGIMGKRGLPGEVCHVGTPLKDAAAPFHLFLLPNCKCFAPAYPPTMVRSLTGQEPMMSVTTLTL